VCVCVCVCVCVIGGNNGKVVRLGKTELTLLQLCGQVIYPFEGELVAKGPYPVIQ
jgi:hypothetical protein